MKKNFFTALSIFMILFLKNVFGYDDDSSSAFITKSTFEYETILKLLIIFGLLISAAAYFFKHHKLRQSSTKKLKENIASLRTESLGTSLKSDSTSKRISLISKIKSNSTVYDKQLAKLARKMRVTTGELALAIQIKEANAKTIR